MTYPGQVKITVIKKKELFLMQNNLELSNKHVLVTGGAGLLGVTYVPICYKTMLK